MQIFQPLEFVCYHAALPPCRQWPRGGDSVDVGSGGVVMVVVIKTLASFSRVVRRRLRVGARGGVEAVARYVYGSPPGAEFMHLTTASGVDGPTRQLLISASRRHFPVAILCFLLEN